MAMTEAQRIGRMAELIVEHHLTNNGWLCGAFDACVENGGSWDLFAKRGADTRAIRVKGSATTDITWKTPNGTQDPFGHFEADDTTDWTAVVTNVELSPEIYLIPTAELVQYIRNARFQNDLTLIHLHFKESSRDVNLPAQFGLNKAFQKYQCAGTRKMHAA